MLMVMAAPVRVMIMLWAWLLILVLAVVFGTLLMRLLLIAFFVVRVLALLVRNGMLDR